MNRGDRSGLATVFKATLLLLAVAVAAHVTYDLLAPLVPALVAISLVIGLAYFLILRR